MAETHGGPIHLKSIPLRMAKTLYGVLAILSEIGLETFSWSAKYQEIKFKICHTVSAILVR